MHEAGIGLISDSHLQRHMMQSAVTAGGYEIALSAEPDRLSSNFICDQSQVQAWIVILTDEDRWDDNLAELIEHATAPCYLVWRRPLESKAGNISSGRSD